MRDFKITRNKGEMYNAEVTDSYGNKYQNYFEHAHEANDWIYYIWENEEWYDKADSEELLEKAILNCKELDKNNNNLRKIL
tara:strand:- start:100 stop:342 length:243 start_codon:yes stop_codon:yes gene_type:complete